MLKNKSDNATEFSGGAQNNDCDSASGYPARGIPDTITGMLKIP
jgi:hypothetical protein